MSRYNSITYPDLNNGPGCRVSVFLQGCPIHCPGCFNSELWDFNGGKQLKTNKVKTIMALLERPYIRGLSILGGEPLAPENLLATLTLCNVASSIPGKDVWIYTGYKYEDLNNKQKRCLENADVLVDGPFVQELADMNLAFRGSSNQRIIDLKRTRGTGEMVLYNV